MKQLHAGECGTRCRRSLESAATLLVTGEPTAPPELAAASGAQTSSWGYLPNLVEHTVVGEDEIIIEARAALATMSASSTTPTEASKGEVLADVVELRALVEEFRTALNAAA